MIRGSAAGRLAAPPSRRCRSSTCCLLFLCLFFSPTRFAPTTPISCSSDLVDCVGVARRSRHVLSRLSDCCCSTTTNVVRPFFDGAAALRKNHRGAATLRRSLPLSGASQRRERRSLSGARGTSISLWKKDVLSE